MREWGWGGMEKARGGWGRRGCGVGGGVGGCEIQHRMCIGVVKIMAPFWNPITLMGAQVCREQEVSRLQILRPFLRRTQMILSLNRGTPIQPPKYGNPDYRDPQ